MVITFPNIQGVRDGSKRGFDEIQVPTDEEVNPGQHRYLTVARKQTQYEMCEAGLSRTDL